MNTKKTAIPVKTFGQLSLGDKIFLVNEGGLLEIITTGISECQDKHGDILAEVLISSGKLDFRINRYFTTGFFIDYSKLSACDGKVFVSTSRQKAGQYLALVKSALLENAEKAYKAASNICEIKQIAINNIIK